MLDTHLAIVYADGFSIAIKIALISSFIYIQILLGQR